MFDYKSPLFGHIIFPFAGLVRKVIRYYSRTIQTPFSHPLAYLSDAQSIAPLISRLNFLFGRRRIFSTNRRIRVASALPSPTANAPGYANTYNERSPIVFKPRPFAFSNETSRRFSCSRTFKNRFTKASKTGHEHRSARVGDRL